MKSNPFEDRMRRGEYFHALRVPDEVWTVLRLDGRSFSKFTAARFEKPFDVRFHELMVGTCRRLAKEFGALYVYTESDEISREERVAVPTGNQLQRRTGLAAQRDGGALGDV